ncbi:MAG: hypothetical protein SVM80_03260 [Halobacteriota archaeon]|nr:hypothetical protein [Halobacteriota archaeon]
MDPLSLVIVFIITILLVPSIKIVTENEIAAIFRLGKLVRMSGPGIFSIIPVADKIIKLDKRMENFDFALREAENKMLSKIEISEDDLLKLKKGFIEGKEEIFHYA